MAQEILQANENMAKFLRLGHLARIGNIGMLKCLLIAYLGFGA
jgi:hypothetical protein